MNRENDENVKTMRQVLEKFKFSKPASEELKKISWRDKRKKQIRILKEAGRYRPAYGAFLFIFYLAANLGIRLTVPQSAVVLIFVSVLAAGTVSGGTYAGVKYITDEPVIEKLDVIDKPVQEEKTAVAKPAIQEKKPVKSIIKKPILGIVPFDLESTTPEKDKEFLTTLRNKINAELTRIKGKSYSKVTSNTDRSIKYAMTGSVVKVGESITINIETIDISNGDTVFSTLEVDTISNLNKVCQNIAKKAVLKVK